MPIHTDVLIEGMDPLEQACRTVEAHVNEGGWDQMPHFYALSLVGGYKTADLEELGARRSPGGLLTVEITLPEFCYTDPAEGLMKFLSFIGNDIVNGDEVDGERVRDTALILNNLIPADFFGFGLIYEAWGVAGDSREEFEQYSRDRTIHLHPNRFELRGLSVATRDGRFVNLSRKRGEFPEFKELDLTDADTIIEGRVPDAVRLVTSFFAEFDDWRERVIKDEMEANEEG